MRASMRMLKTYYVPFSQSELIRDFEEICKAKGIPQSGVIISLIKEWVRDHRRELLKEKKLDGGV